MAPITAQGDRAEAESAKAATRSIQTALKQPENTSWETEDEPLEVAEPESPDPSTIARNEKPDALPPTTRNRKAPSAQLKTTPTVHDIIIVEKPPADERGANSIAFVRSSKTPRTPPQQTTTPQGAPPAAPARPRTRQENPSVSSKQNVKDYDAKPKTDTVLSLLSDILITVTSLKVDPSESDKKKTILSLIGRAVKKTDEENQRVEQERMTAIEQSISEIKAMVIAQPPTSPNDGRKTWAQAASIPPPHLVEAAKYERQQKLKEQREKTEVTLSFRESPANTRAEDVRALSEAAIAECLQKSIDEASRSNGALRSIKNLSVKKVSKWCLKVICSTPEDATTLRAVIDWEKVMGAKLATTVYGVVVHGVAKSDINPTANEPGSALDKGIKDLETINSIKVRRLAPLLRKPRNPGAPTHSIIIFVENPNQADHLILRGVHIANRHYNVEKYMPRSQLTQCYKCQGFGHRAEGCTRPPKMRKVCKRSSDKSMHRPTEAKCALCDRLPPRMA
jgi:hypothetical protein